MRVSAWLFLLLQLLGSACILRAAGRAAGLAHCPPWRLLLACLPPSLLAMAAADVPLLRLMLTPLCALTPLAVWPGMPHSLRLRLALLGLTLPLCLAGLLRLFSVMPAALCIPSGCGMLLLLCRRDRHPASPPRCTAVEVTLGRHTAVLTALVDSGNLLRDPITGLPVIVISRRAAARLTPLPPEGSLLPGMRLMRVHTAAGASLMPILRPDRLRIRPEGTWQQTEALIGIAPGGEGFQALVPASLVSTAPAIPLNVLSHQTGG